jgi:thioredoxin reductase (NADPH)
MAFKQEKYDVVIIGSGPAGLTCALYCARAGLSALIIDRGMQGGQMAMTEWIDNYPGFHVGVEGAKLGEFMNEHAKRFGAESAYATVERIVEKDSEGMLTVETDMGPLKARAVVVATGAAPAELGAPGETELRGRGVSYCAVCDGNFFQGQDVCVIGGGDAAVEEASYLAKLCRKVYIVHRRDKLRAAKAAQDAAASKENIVFALNSLPMAILGDSEVTALKIKDAATGVEKDLPCSGVFIYVGIKPATDFARGTLDLDENGFIVTDNEMRTSMDGVYAAGDARRPRNRQVVTACADGATAALTIERILNEQPDRWRKQ